MSILRTCSLVLLLGVMTSVPALAGSAVVGSVAGSLNATVGGQAVLPHQAIFSGDSLQVKDGAFVVATDNGSRMAFGRDTTAMFQRDPRVVTVVLSSGNVSLYHADARVGLRVKAGVVTVEAAPGYKTLGDVAMVNGAVVVTTKDGALSLSDGTRTVQVPKGKTVTLNPKTARAPQTGGSQALGGGASTYLTAGALGAGVAAAILAGIAMSRAGDAKTQAANANSNAILATSAASAADSDAIMATSFATAAANNANNVGCSLNLLAQDLDQAGFGYSNPSPYFPIAPYTCPAVGVTPH